MKRYNFMQLDLSPKATVNTALNWFFRCSFNRNSTLSLTSVLRPPTSCWTSPILPKIDRQLVLYAQSTTKVISERRLPNRTSRHAHTQKATSHSSDHKHHYLFFLVVHDLWHVGADVGLDGQPMATSHLHRRLVHVLLAVGEEWVGYVLGRERNYRYICTCGYYYFYLLKAYSPINCTVSPQGLQVQSCRSWMQYKRCTFYKRKT